MTDCEFAAAVLSDEGRAAPSSWTRPRNSTTSTLGHYEVSDHSPVEPGEDPEEEKARQEARDECIDEIWGFINDDTDKHLDTILRDILTDGQLKKLNDKLWADEEGVRPCTSR